MWHWPITFPIKAEDSTWVTPNWRLQWLYRDNNIPPSAPTNLWRGATLGSHSEMMLHYMSTTCRWQWQYMYQLSVFLNYDALWETVLQVIFTARCTLVQSAVLLSYVVCPSVTIRYCDHIGWNSSKIISRPNSLGLGPMWGLTPTWAIWCKGNTPKIGVE